MWLRLYVAEVECGSSVLKACCFTLKTVHQFQVSVPSVRLKNREFFFIRKIDFFLFGEYVMV